MVCDDELPPLQLDRHKLLQIVLNLLNNARDAVQNASDRRVVLRCTLREGRLRIAVEDKGYGILAENLPRIFNYGFTTKPHGHGFGLHSSAIAAADLGGSLECRSPGQNQGATFTLELPMTPVASRLAS